MLSPWQSLPWSNSLEQPSSHCLALFSWCYLSLPVIFLLYFLVCAFLSQCGRGSVNTRSITYVRRLEGPSRKKEKHEVERSWKKTNFWLEHREQKEYHLIGLEKWIGGRPFKVLEGLFWDHQDTMKRFKSKGITCEFCFWKIPCNSSKRVERIYWNGDKTDWVYCKILW